MNALVVALALSSWAALLIAAATHAEASISSSASRSNWLRIVACGAMVAIGSSQGRDHPAFAAAVASIAVVVGAFADAKTGYLFDAITIPAAVVTGTVAIATGFAAEAMWGVVLLVGIFGGVAVFSRGRAIGLGDVKAMYAIGAGFGPAKAILILFSASVSGLVVTLVAKCIARRASVSREIHFGPHLAIGSSLALIAGDRIVHGALGL
jgi:prepilin signal peptidase PulO-like enzyme (type II secretory pathway)